ncbi:MAG TPA: PilZ domain-containing protein [Kofleriaceae bacterium]|nr:PilZ domain-containing protein [Kofleriaceae bacterium]
MNDRAGAPERRRHVRITPKGSLSFNALGHEERCRIANLSEGGAFVLTKIETPERLLERAIQVQIRVDDRDAEWLHATGHVVRIRADGVALAFDTLAPSLLRMIDVLSIASRARARTMSILLVDGDEQRRSAMAAGFRTTGCAVVQAATPLEAVVRLGESSFELDIIAVADSQPSTVADELRAFVAKHHPHAKLVTLGDDVLQPDGFANWKRGSDVSR